MSYPSRLYVLLALAAGGGACMLSAMAGCGDDNSVSGGDSGGDSTADSSGDSMAAETGTETGTGGDASEAGADGNGSDVTDAGSGFVDVGDVAIDVPSLSDFPHAVDNAYCTRLEQCCMLSGGQQWNQNGANGCVPLLDMNGGVFGIADFNAALDSGLVGYDASAARTCLDTVLSYTCGVGPSSAIDLARDLCFGAMQGTLTSGNGPCVNSLECANGLYCRLSGDSGTGTCAPLQTQGQPCSDTVLSTDCSYLGNGTPALYCSDPGDGGTPTCQPALPLDAGCNSNAQCQTWDCNYPVCTNVFVFSDPGNPGGICATFTVVDAGAD